MLLAVSTFPLYCGFIMMLATMHRLCYLHNRHLLKNFFVEYPVLKHFYVQSMDYWLCVVYAGIGGCDTVITAVKYYDQCDIVLLWHIILHSAGDQNSPPRLLRKSADGCHFELLWYTASACAVGRLYGDDCQVNYPAMGS